MSNKIIGEIKAHNMTMSLKKILLSWSGGKDSAMALHEIQKTKTYEVVALLTTVTDGYDRISMHGVREELLERQAESLDLRLHKILIPKNAKNEEYESNIKEVLIKYQNENVNSVAFGDIFLGDLRKYREDKLSVLGIKAIFPLWQKDTLDLAKSFINLGFKAIITCIDTQFLDKKFVGRKIDSQFKFISFPMYINT